MGLYHPKAERQDGESGHFKVLGSKRQPDNRDGENRREKQVHQCQFQSR